ncbi:MAG: S24/S26 family peptidase [Patescibacteria group bacterium]
MKKNFYYKLVSDSMAPQIEVEDIVLITKSFDKSDPQSGSLILFSDKNKKVLHRIIKKTGKDIFLKGDNAFELQKISFSQIEGIAQIVFSGKKVIVLGKAKEKLFIFLDKLFFQRIYFLRFFKYRVFRYKIMKKIKNLLW